MTPDQKEKELERTRKAQQTVNAFHRVFNSEDGKAVLTELKAKFAPQMPAFVERPGGFCSLHAAKRDGQRDVFVAIDAILEMPMVADANIEKPATKVITQ